MLKAGIALTRRALFELSLAVLPPVCLLCGSLHIPVMQLGTERRSGALCPPCLTDFPETGPLCPVCALPGIGAEKDPCDVCQSLPPGWDRVFAAAPYGFPVDRLVQLLKFNHELAAGVALAQLMLSRPNPLHRASTRAPTLLIPVPLHWLREGRRGFNQATEIALHLGHAGNVPLAHRWLRRQRRTAAQSSLDANARHRNLEGAFRWDGPPLQGERIILLDDVMTTGSTVSACTQVLQQAGAGQVVIWVAARALNRPAVPSAHDRASGC